MSRLPRSSAPIESAAMVARPALPRRFGRLRIEDVLLFAWVALVSPLLFRAGEPPGAPEPDFLQALVDLVALAGFGLCLGARGRPGDTSGLWTRTDVAYAVGPLFGAVAFVGEDATRNLGPSAGDSLPVPMLVLVGAVVIGRFGLQPLSSPQRRALVMPFTLAAGGFMTEFVAGTMTEALDLRALAAGIAAGDLVILLTAAFATLAVAVFYVMLVFAPRQVADREGTPGTWLFRFLLFVAGVAVSGTWLGVVS